MMDENADYDIFVAKVDSSWQKGDGSYLAKAQVAHVYRGSVLEEVIIASGGNTSAGGFRLQTGARYLIVSSADDGYNYAAFVCDQYSTIANLNRKEKSKTDNDHYSIIDQYYDLKENGYSGKVRLKTKSRLFAEGKMERGLPIGTWKHYVKQNDQDIIRSTIHYKNGYQHGECTYKNHYQMEHAQRVIIFDEGIIMSESELELNIVRSRKIYHYTDSLHVRIEHSKYTSKGQLEEQSFHYQLVKPLRNPHIFIPSRLDSNYRSFYPNGMLKTTGHYHFGAKVGTWLSYDSLGQKLDCKEWAMPNELKFDEKGYHPDGSIAFSGNYNDGKRDGVWKTYCLGGGLQTKAEYQGGYLNGLMTKYRCTEGTRYVSAEYKNHRLHGEEICYDRDGISMLSRGTYIDGQAHGIFDTWFRAGTLKQRVIWVNGKREGMMSAYHIDGSLHKSARYQNDHLDGDYVEYVDRQIKEKGKYIQGKKVGQWQINYPKKNRYNLHYFNVIEKQLKGGNSKKTLAPRPISKEEYLLINANDPNIKHEM